MPAPYLRNASDSRFTTLGRELTIVEGDQQFIYLKDQIDGIKSVAGLTPYNAGTEYTGGLNYVVGWASKAWLFVSDDDHTGVTPGTNSAVWQEINVNSLVHQQNTDTALGYGTSNQVTASELRNFLDAVNAPVAILHSEFLTLFQGGTLVKDVVYNITDKSLYVRAMSNRSIEGHGLVERVVPNWVGYFGGLHSVWTPDAEPAINDKMIFADKVYKNLTGTNLTTIPPDDLDNWEEVAGNTTDYRIEYYGCGIMFRRDENRIAAIDIITSTGDKIQSTDFNVPSYNSRFNSASITINHGSSQLVDSNKDVFIGVTEQNRGIIAGNSGNANFNVTGNFLGELKHNIAINAVIGVTNPVSGFKFNKNIVEMKRSGSSGTAITLRPDAIIENCVINSKGSDAVDVLDGSTAVTGDTLDLNANGLNDVYGVFEIDTADININSAIGWPSTNFSKIILRPKAGREINYSTTFASSDNQLVDYSGAGGLLVGDNSDYAILERVVVAGFNCIRITPVQQF